MSLLPRTFPAAPVQERGHGYPRGSASVAREGSDASPLPAPQPLPRRWKTMRATYKLDGMPGTTLKRKAEGQYLTGTCAGGSGLGGWRSHPAGENLPGLRPVGMFLATSSWKKRAPGAQEESSGPSPGLGNELQRLREEALSCLPRCMLAGKAALIMQLSRAITHGRGFSAMQLLQATDAPINNPNKPAGTLREPSGGAFLCCGCLIEGGQCRFTSPH